MKKLKTLIFLLMVSHSFVFGTHNMAGRIVYKQISNLTYEASIITYTKTTGPSIQADRDRLDINWGDGITETVFRTSHSMLTGTTIKENIYTATHTYSSHANYTISMQDPNRNDGVINIDNGASVNVPFYLESELLLSNGTYNNSVEYLAAPILEAEAGKVFRYNLTSMDIDGDILTYELVSPKSDVGVNVPNYFIPDTATVFYLNGELVWKIPQVVGAYSFAVKVKEYRNGVLVGSTIVDMQVNVVPPVNKSQFTGISNWSVDADNNYSYTLSPLDTIELSLGYKDSLVTSVNLGSYSEAFEDGNTATFTPVLIGNLEEIHNFKWVPTVLNARCAPYIITFRGESTTNQIISKDITLMVWVRDSSLNYCDALINQLDVPIKKIRTSEKKITTNIYPNPFTDQTTVSVDIDGTNREWSFQLFDIYGNEILSNWTNDTAYILERNKLTTGMYIYEIRDALGNRQTGKIVVN